MNPHALIDAEAAATLSPNLRASTIRTWQARRRVTCRGRDQAGRNLYDAADIAHLVTLRDEWVAAHPPNDNGVV